MNAHCCEDMRREVEQTDGNSATGFVYYAPEFREYGLLTHDNGESCFRFCPWCGALLPASLRGEWFAEMERLGIDPYENEAPAEFRSAAWWQQRPAGPGAVPDRAGE